jgi:hypothetical protein
MAIPGDSLTLAYQRTPEMIAWDLILGNPEGVTHEFRGQGETVFHKPGAPDVMFRNDASNTLHIASADRGNPESIVYALPPHCPMDTAKPAWFKEFFGLTAGTEYGPASAKRPSGRAPGLSTPFRESRRP